MRIVNLIAIALILNSVAEACSCNTGIGLSDASYEGYLSDVDAIFLGEVVDDGGLLQSIFSSFPTIKFKVHRAWKGIEDVEVEVETDASTSCAFVPPVGAQRTIYAYRNTREGSSVLLAMNYCSRVELSEAERMQKLLGPGIVPRQKEPAIKEVSFLQRLWEAVRDLF